MASSGSGAATLARRYAAALFALADDAGALEPALRDIETLSALLDESADLRRLTASPVIARADQERAMLAVLERAGVGETVRNFTGVVARNRRLFALPAMMNEFRALYARHRGEHAAEVTSARPLTPKQKSAVAAALKSALGGDVAVDEKVDPGLLGGLVVRVGSRMVDGSVKTKLQQMRLAMKGTA
ncbi:MAG: F0F1 ATP synthase subunit delta [Rhodospirillales bacterium]